MTFQPGPAQILEKIPLIEEDKEGKGCGHLLGAKGQYPGKDATCKQDPLLSLFPCKTGLCIEQKGKDIEHGRHAVHPLDNIGDRLGLNRVNDPDQGSEQGYPGAEVVRHPRVKILLLKRTTSSESSLFRRAQDTTEARLGFLFNSKNEIISLWLIKLNCPLSHSVQSPCTP